MVTFEIETKGLAVKIDGRDLGIITQDYGFYTDVGILRTWLRVSAEDLRQIADKAQEVMGAPAHEAQPA